ncbi:MBOAT family protein [Clostridium sp.]|uniref:MBOAT family O-acyltransferase n=1 Tax=Clostridium sp. TaxID=1506 RepID=UPI002FCAC3A7
MVFTSTVFMFMFLPIVVGGYFLIRKEFRNMLLLLASLLFYAWGEPKFVLVMLLSIIINFYFGVLIHKNFENKSKKKLYLVICLVLNLGLLIFFKYANFLVHNLNSLMGLVSIEYTVNLRTIPLPIGISFFTFQGLSYVVDVYRKDTKVQKNIFDLALYIALFPQLIAGPIVRYQDVDREIEKREITIDKTYYGIRRFIMGFAKKILIANGTGEIADKIFAIPSNELTAGVAWLGIICYTLQIYYDFSGYSDMAIGLGKVFGFNFLENFNYPYISKSIREFWKRWHISLTTWFRDYLYIPLGGNRCSTAKSYRNQIIVFLLSGLWHGASWNFIFWGAFHGTFLVIERTPIGKVLNRLWAPIRHLYALLIIMVGWVFFRAENLTAGWNYVKAMFSATGTSNLYYPALYLNNKSMLILVAGIIFSAPIMKYLKGFIKGSIEDNHEESTVKKVKNSTNNSNEKNFEETITNKSLSRESAVTCTTSNSKDEEQNANSITLSNSDLRELSKRKDEEGTKEINKLKSNKSSSDSSTTIYYYLRDLTLIVLFVVCLVTLSSTTYNPFIYFRF